MSGIGTWNLKVLLLDTDFYALQAVNSYLAWDRRTRVTFLAENDAAMWEYVNRTPEAELPDVVVMDVVHLSPGQLTRNLERLHDQIPNVQIMCLLQIADVELVEAAAEAGVRAFMLKSEVRLQIAWAIVYMLEHEFTVTQGIARAARDARLPSSRLFRAAVLPEQREYPELTERLRQAIKLCVVEGMPAHLAADEMGISLHTIRGYVKEGYRILESYDETEYPVDMTPQERAFMRFTALADDGDDG